MRQRLITGLGNPGRDYAGTRHNAGFLLVDRLIESLGAKEVRSPGHSVLWAAHVGDVQVFLMKPLTYMNLSGHAVISFLQEYPIPVSDILIAYDDVAIPVGALRLRPSGSAGGQKGIRHIMECLETDQVPRLRIGIDGPARQGRPLPDFVLEEFGSEEAPLIEDALTRAAEAATLWLREEITAVMAMFNAKAPVALSEKDT